MIHVLSDDPDGSDRLAQLKVGLGDGELQQLNTTTYDGQKVTFDELFNACEAMPFLAERRLVVVRGLLARFGSKAGARDRGKEEGGGEERKIPELARQLRDYLPRVPSSTDLALVEGAPLGKQNPLYKALVAAQANFAQTAPMAAEALAEWIERRVTAKGGRLARGMARVLASYGGQNLRALDSELEKLIAYAGGQAIEAKAIEQLVDAAREQNVYKLGDALAAGDARVALQQLHALLEGGEHPLYILTMVVRHFRLLCQIKDLRERGLPGDAIAARLRLPLFVVDRLGRQLRRYPTFGQLERVYRRLLESDEAAKTGGRDLAINLELLILELARR